jgi:uncharacterized protein Smg (DUF494 family)
MTVSEISTYEALKARFGENETKMLLEFLSEQVKERSASQRDLLATKEELKKVEADIRKEDTRLEITIKSEIARIENRMIVIEGNLRTEIERGFKDQLKWLIILMLGFISLTITVIKLL